MSLPPPPLPSPLFTETQPTNKNPHVRIVHLCAPHTHTPSCSFLLGHSLQTDTTDPHVRIVHLDCICARLTLHPLLSLSYRDITCRQNTRDPHVRIVHFHCTCARLSTPSPPPPPPPSYRYTAFRQINTRDPHVRIVHLDCHWRVQGGAGRRLTVFVNKGPGCQGHAPHTPVPVPMTN